MKKNNAKNTNKKNDIAAVEEVVAEETLNPIETMETENAVDEDSPTVVTAEEAASEPDASAEVEIHADATDPTEHHIRVKSDNGIYDVTVHAESRQDAKYRVYLNLEQFGPNAVLPKFDVDKYLARKNAAPKKGGKKKGEGKKARNLIVVDLDAPAPETEPAEPVETETAEAEV